MSLLAELKRRHIFRVAVAYAVVGWALIEVSSTMPVAVLDWGRPATAAAP